MIAAVNSKWNVVPAVLCFLTIVSTEAEGDSADKDAGNGHPRFGIKNPLIEQRADPWCIRHADGNYYFTATVPEYDRIELRRAGTIAGLRDAKPKVIWHKHETGPMSYHIWAPEIHHIDGKWYVYFAAGRAEDIWAIRMYVLECSTGDPLAGEWVERGQLKTNWESFPWMPQPLSMPVSVTSCGPRRILQCAATQISTLLRWTAPAR